MSSAASHDGSLSMLSALERMAVVVLPRRSSDGWRRERTGMMDEGLAMRTASDSQVVLTRGRCPGVGGGFVSQRKSWER